MDHADVARVCHEVNRAYCEATGDMSQRPWDEALPDQQLSAVAGVTRMFHNRETTPEELHESWMAEKVAQGWKLGPEKSAEMRTHPAMVPYSELPQHQRTKDYLFRAVCLSLLSTPEAVRGSVPSAQISKEVHDMQDLLVEARASGRYPKWDGYLAGAVQTVGWVLRPEVVSSPISLLPDAPGKVEEGATGRAAT